MACPLRLVLVAVSAVVALVALVWCQREEAVPRSVAPGTALQLDDTGSSTSAKQRSGALIVRKGLQFTVDAFTGRYLYTQLTRLGERK